MSAADTMRQRALLIAEIARIKADPNAVSILTGKLAQAQVIYEETELSLRAAVESLAAQGGRDPEEAWNIIAEFPRWCIAQFEEAIAEVSA